MALYKSYKLYKQHLISILIYFTYEFMLYKLTLVLVLRIDSSRSLFRNKVMLFF